ncbi:aldo/keto reductase [Candidatus Nitrososphaera gargensis Ga9.2]|uniref:Aldo/keto reductase n=1 Tax=Nitrososphaera gargensis (strain Ga9.2) TaxID=1237085 RepID=K0IL81_NITGG|nr:aldo/keto reductase [Candidatus Nitrososphaera gargensis Ga9.2]
MEKCTDKAIMSSSTITVPKRKFGWTGVEVPVVGQGTWMIEGNTAPVASRRHAVEALRLGLDLGLTHIDTAEMYGNGRVEEIVAEAVAGRREQVFLVSKVLPSNASYEGTIAACRRSLKRLRTEWLDLYLLHWPSGYYPIKETMRAMEKLADDGLIRFIGVSNFDVAQLEEAQQALSKYRIACNQVPYNLSDRQVELDLLPYCADRHIAVVGYSPFGHGYYFPSPGSRQGQLLADIGRRHGRTPRQVVLNYLIRHPETFTIPKARRPEHVIENSRGAGWSLTEKDIAAIDRAFPL